LRFADSLLKFMIRLPDPLFTVSGENLVSSRVRIEEYVLRRSPPISRSLNLAQAAG
jgi:hypothetical protein